MIVSRRWLEALLGRTLDAREVAEQLTMHAAAVDGVVPLHQDLGDVLIGRVLEVTKHPNADRLSLCRVDAGGAEPVDVVCGAPNVQAGKTYPYAPVGATLPGGVKLERRKIRGVESNGMLCSAKELGLGDDHAGILELDTTAPPGSRFLDAVPVADHQIVTDVPANRPDLLCHKGVARELAAVLGGTVKLPPISGAGSAATAAEGGVPAGRGRASRDRGKLDRRPAQHRRQFAGDPLVAQQVGAVRGDVDDNLMIRYGHHVQEPAPRRCGGVELEDAGVVFAETELFGGAEHAVRLDAADLAALELHAARQRGAHRCVGVGLARLHVGSAADDFDGPAACLDEAHRQPVRAGMLLHLEHTPEQDVAQVLVQRHDGVHRRDVHSELLGDLARVERAAQQRLEPAARDDHRTPPANCARKRTSLSYSSRMSAMPWRVMAMRAGPIPQANPE